MTNSEQAIAELIDRQRIWDCLLRYARGVDRVDRELTLSAYWPDAVDEHGVMEGVAEVFVDWTIGRHGALAERHQHLLSNLTIDLDGDTAHTETYFIFSSEHKDGPHSLAMGRYVDRFEKRSGEWRIAHRVCVTELMGDLVTAPVLEASAQVFEKAGPSRQDRSDVSYRRPLVRDHAA